MAEIKISLPEELEEELKEFPEVKWQVVVRRILKEEVEKLLELKKIVSKSKLTEKDVLELSSKVNESLSNRFKEGRISTSEAANRAGLTVGEMMEALVKRGVKSELTIEEYKESLDTAFRLFK